MNTFVICFMGTHKLVPKADASDNDNRPVKLFEDSISSDQSYCNRGYGNGLRARMYMM